MVAAEARDSAQSLIQYEYPSTIQHQMDPKGMEISE